MSRLLSALCLLMLASRAHAVGVDGAAAADRRSETALGAGFDHVGGYGRDTYPFVELGLATEARLYRHLAVGGIAGFRQDLDDYNYALGQWRHRHSPALAARAFVGYEGPRFHLSVGPSIYGARRDREHFRTGLLPISMLRLRVGHQDGWHFVFRLGDTVAATAEGGPLGLRAMVGAPAMGDHRLTGGVYTTLGEHVVGLVGSDEVVARLPFVRAIRWGACLGLDFVHLARMEATGFAALVF